MRHGLIRWREKELSAADVKARQARLQQAIADAGLDGILIYTTHVRSAGVTYASGFTPYWSDGMLLVLREGRPVLLTALSKRVGEWVKSVNPTVDVDHSPFPGKLAGQRLQKVGAKRVGIVELDRFPAGLVDEINSVAPVELRDVTELFTKVRSRLDSAESNLAHDADRIAKEAFAVGDLSAVHAGDFTGAVERSARLAGAEECYVAVAPDLAKDLRFIRTGKDVLGRTFAVRLSIAYNGVWIRRIETFSANPETAAVLRSVGRLLDSSALTFWPRASIADHYLPGGAQLLNWHLEIPYGTNPLKVVADARRPLVEPIPYGVLTTAFRLKGETIVAARPVGLDLPRDRETAA